MISSLPAQVLDINKRKNTKRVWRRGKVKKVQLWPAVDVGGSTSFGPLQVSTKQKPAFRPPVGGELKAKIKRADVSATKTKC